MFQYDMPCEKIFPVIIINKSHKDISHKNNLKLILPLQEKLE